MKRWGVFLDRDGTLVPDARYPSRPEQLVLYPGAAMAVASLHAAGARILLVSNQSAVARGLLDERGLGRMDRHLRGLLRPAGGRLAGSYYCTHHPEFTGPCDCRKPAPGLLLRGLGEHRLAAEACYLVGDTEADMRAGRSAGVRTVLVLSGYGRRHRKEVLRLGLADHVSSTLVTAARWILRDRATLQ